MVELQRIRDAACGVLSAVCDCRSTDREIFMKRPGLLSVLVLALGLAACANTIKGAGRDTANAVDATKQAGEEVAEAIE